MQPPGRNMRMREQPITTCQHMAAALLPIVASRLATMPYVVRGPSFMNSTWQHLAFMTAFPSNSQHQPDPMPNS